MEGSESEAIYDSLNLNPQLSINEVLNSVGDLVDGAFDLFHQEASDLLKTNGTGRAADLKKGVDYIHHLVNAALNKRLSMWEKYCLHHCLVVPDRFLLPDKDDFFPRPDDELMNDFAMDLDVLNDQQSDSRLNIPRDRLSQVGKESAELNRQLQALERQQNMSNHCATAVTEALKLYDENAHGLFGEMMNTAAQSMEKNEHGRRERINGSKEDISKLNCSKGLSNLNLLDLQHFLNEIRKARSSG